jgi:glycerophosphoryl diester phosphodiesterase
MDVEFIAHRGSSFLAPENTLAAVQLAWQEGADAVEGDFRLTKDGHLVCIHDASLKRTAGVDRLVADCTLEELRAYDVGSWKCAQFGGQRIPRLEELLATVPPGKRFFVELKSRGSQVIAALQKGIAGSSLDPRQIVLICLDFPTIVMVKHAISLCPAHWVVQAERDSLADGDHRWPHGLPEAAKSAKLDGLDLEAIWPIDTTIIRDLKSAGFQLAVWTVDDPAMARWWIDLGIHSITTNRPGWLRSQLRL